MIRKLLIVAAAIYFGKKAYEALATGRTGEQLGQDNRVDNDGLFNPVISPEMADKLRAVTTTAG